jgi:hypothetical protein
MLDSDHISYGRHFLFGVWKVGFKPQLLMREYLKKIWCYIPKNPWKKLPSFPTGNPGKNYNHRRPLSYR